MSEIEERWHEGEIYVPATEWFPASALGASQYPVRMNPVIGRVECIASGCLNTVDVVSKFLGLDGALLRS